MITEEQFQAPAIYQPAWPEKIFGHFISFVLHPVFVPFYVVFFLVTFHPSAFTGFSGEDKGRVLLMVALNAVFFPLLTVLLLKALGFVATIQLRDQKDRIIPLIASGIFFFWTFIVFKEQPRFSWLLKSFFLGIFLASSLGLIVNIFIKPSLHAIGMGGWLGFFLVILASQTMLMTWPIMLVLLLTGLVCSARLMVSDHNFPEIISGLFIGLICQMVAAAFV